MPRRKPKLLIFQHVPYEPLGTLNPLLKRAGFRIRYVNFGRHPDACPSLSGYDGLIVLGGPMNADEQSAFPNLATELDLIHEATVAGTPVLGICLGAQLLAKSHGGSIHPARGSEIGWHPVYPNPAAVDDPVLSAFGQDEMLFHWHLDSIELPPSALLLAHSQRCSVQAFRIGQNAWGFQFHLEVDRSLIRRWLVVPENQAGLWACGGDELAGRIAVETRRRIDTLQRLAAATFGRWIDLFEFSPRRMSLPSR